MKKVLLEDLNVLEHDVRGENSTVIFTSPERNLTSPYHHLHTFLRKITNPPNILLA